MFPLIILLMNTCAIDILTVHEFSLALAELLMFLQILDCVLGHNDALFRRAQLKALVSIHSQEVNLTQSEFLYMYRSHYSLYTMQKVRKMPKQPITE